MPREQCWNRLVRRVRVAPRIERSFVKNIRRHIYGLLMNAVIEQRASPRDCRLHHDEASAGPKDLTRGAQELHRELDMVQYVDHHNVAKRRLFERQILCVGNKTQPGTELNVRRDYIGQALFELANSGADPQRRPRAAAAAMRSNMSP